MAPTLTLTAKSAKLFNSYYIVSFVSSMHVARVFCVSPSSTPYTQVFLFAVCGRSSNMSRDGGRSIVMMDLKV
jgi:hypothetical protein